MNCYPLSPSQLHLWKSQIISPEIPLFNQVSTATLPRLAFNDADAVAMCQAWENVQRIHPVFATRIFDDGNGNPSQACSNNITPMVQFNFVPDEGNYNNDDIVIQEWIQKRSQINFVLSEGLVDCALLRSGSKQVVIYLNMHHLIADALSTALIWDTLLVEFSRLQTQAGSQAEGQGYGREKEQEKEKEKEQEQEQEQEHYQEHKRTATMNIALNGLNHNHSPPQYTFFDYITTLPALFAQVKVKQQGFSPRSAQTPLPCFYGQHPAKPTTQSVRVTVELSDSEREALQQIPDQQGFKLINQNLGEMCVHLTALVIFLHKVTEDTAIVLDAPIAGRFDKRWMKTVGNFIEMIRLRVSVCSDHTAMDVYANTRQALYSSLGNAAPGCTSHLQTEPVHGVLNLISTNTKGSDKTPAHLQWHHPEHSDTNHPFRLHVSDWNKTNRPSIDLDLNFAFFNETGRTHAPTHLAGIYRSIMSAPSTRLCEMSFLASDERWQFHGSAASRAAQPSTMPAALEKIARRRPTSVAVADEHRSLTYKELMESATRVNQQLQAHGIGHGERVAVLMARGLYLPVVLLGVLQSGAAYVPIDIDQPDQRMLNILNEASVACVICDTENDTVARHGHSVFLASDLMKGNPPSSQYQLAAPADPAYIIFTSGSTGKPKGVVVCHDALMNYLTWAERYYRLNSAIVMPLFTSIAFDLTVTSMFLPWLSGGHVQVVTQTDIDPATLLFSVFANKVTNTIKLTPAHLALLTHYESTSTSIEQLILGGEDLKSTTVEQARARFTQSLRVINEYGPTEATVGSVVKDWPSSSETGSVPIGKPISNTSAYVLNNYLQPQFEGMVGELYLGGHSLASGYWNNTAMTDERFIPHPWQSGKRLYRTGDLVRVKNDELVYLGRMDTQLNVRGHRVELAEVEAVIASHPEVSECVVIGSDTNRVSNLDNKAPLQAVSVTQPESFCKHCGLSSKHPDAELNIAGICVLCSQYTPNQSRVDEYFKTNEELTLLIKDIKSTRRGHYDAVVLLSGGKDSTFALSKLVDLGLTVYAFSLNNGFISDQAKNNIDKVCEFLGIDHHYANTAHMNDIFADSLSRYSNVCHGCFKTIYTLSLEFAAKHNIDYVFTGLSRGQLFETRLNNELFTDIQIPISKIDDMVQAARIQYHAFEDAPHRLLNIDAVNSGALPSKVSMIDFYRYCHVEMSDMLDYLQTRVGWVRPQDTGRSTNCLINDVGIHVHKLERGFHNYSLPYSWDVRLGHKTRQDAMDELNDELDLERIQLILDEIGYEPKRLSDTEFTQTNSAINAYYTATNELEPVDMENWLTDKLPNYMHPQDLIRVSNMPLSSSGKVDRQAVVLMRSLESRKNRPSRALTGLQQTIAKEWNKHVRVVSIDANDNFFQIGGDSLSAIRCVMSLRRDGYSIDPADLFRRPVLIDFCQLLESQTKQSINSTSIAEAPKQFSSLKTSQSEKLKKLLQRGLDS